MTNLDAAAPTEEITPPLLDCWYLTGPTASGKTGVAIELAARLQAEIVSLDSMAVYQGMDIGTAKPSRELRARIPHHMIDIVPPVVDYSVSEYIRCAHEIVRQLKAAGKEALFVGGTPLYLKTLLRGIYHGPPADWEFRREVEAEVQRVGIAALRERLQQVDPLLAHKLHPHDQRRMIRALEVYKLTGRPLSHLQTQFDEAHAAASCRVFVLSWPRPVLHRRIELRVESMFQQGLVAETQQLIDRYGQLGRTASQAVGYREVLETLAGRRDQQGTIRAVQIRTKQFARRQETWFRSLRECRRVWPADDQSPAAVADAILNLAGPSPGSSG